MCIANFLLDSKKKGNEIRNPLHKFYSQLKMQKQFSILVSNDNGK